MSRFSTFGFLNPFVQSRWKERAEEWDKQHGLKAKKNRLRASEGDNNGSHE